MRSDAMDILFQDAEAVLQRVNFKSIDGATVLVTGATGLIGTHLLASLCLLNRNGYRLNVHGQYHSTPSYHTQQLAGYGRLTLCRNILPGQADVIIHAAGYAQPAVFTANAVETIRVNTALTQQLLEHLSPAGRFLFVSSSEVYSGLSKWSALETDIGCTTPYHSRACYIEGKRCGEAITNAYRQTGSNARSARVSLTYGPGVRKNDKRALSVIIDKALVGRIDMAYSGREMRTCSYVRDAVETLWNIALHGTKPVYNVGGHSAANIAELAAIVSRITGAPLDMPDADNELEGSPQSVRMDTSLAQAEFGKTEYVSLNEGLRRTIEWHRGLHEPV